MVTNTRKSFLRFALVGGVLALTLAGCGDSNYENFEECQLKETQKLSQKSKDLSDAALGVIIDFCIKYPTRSEQEEERKPAAKIADPKWIVVGPKKGFSNGARIFIDVNNIETDGYKKTFWVRELNKAQTLEGNNFGISKKMVDCSSGAMTNLLSGKMVNGNGSGKEEFRNVPIVPGGSNAAIYQYICEKK